MANPVWKNEVFKTTAGSAGTAPLRLKSVVHKALFCLLILSVSTIYMWTGFYAGKGIVLPTVIAVGGGIAGFYVSYAIPGMSFLTVPLFTLLEGITVGGISSVIEIFYPGIILNAVTLTYIAALLVLLMYRFGFLSTGNMAFRVFSLSAGSILIFYILKFVMAVFSVHFLYFISPIGIGICLAVAAVGSANLIGDMDFIRTLEVENIRRRAEWTAAFGIMVTVGWVYLEVARIVKVFKNFISRHVRGNGQKLSGDKEDTSGTAEKDPAAGKADSEK